MGGVTHSLLDAMFQTDVLLLYPADDGGVLRGLLGRGAIHVGCLMLGGAGAAILWGKTRRRQTG